MHIYLVALYVAWMLFFNLIRVVFFVYNSHLLTERGQLFPIILSSIFHAWQLDTAMVCYFLLFPWLLLVTSSWRRPIWVYQVIDGYHLVVVPIYALIALGEAFVYPEWKTKLNYRAITSLARPSELWRVTDGMQFFFGILLVLLLSTLGVFFLLYVRKKILVHSNEKALTSILMIVWPFALGLGARGGAKPISIDASRVYFADDATINDGTANSTWCLAKTISDSRKYGGGKNPFAFFAPEDAAEEVKKLHQNKSGVTKPHISVVNSVRPNIVFIVLESWSADLVESLGGESGLTPNFHSLEKEGLLFTQFYANGNRSQQGMASIFTGFPALPLVTVSDDASRVRKLPEFARNLGSAGYQTSFLYGGQLEYGNIKALLMANGFGKIIEEENIAKDVPRGSLGIHDGYMLDQLLDHVDQQSSPFLTGLFTLSTHAPYDIPMAEQFHFGGLEAGYVKSAMYADAELGRFFQEAKKRPWYKDTLFVLVADHSHNTYRNWPNWRPEYRKIPMMFLGGALDKNFVGKTWGRVASQIDISATLLNQVGLDSKAYSWSKDIFNPASPSFAYYELNNGVGWVDETGSVVYNRETQSIMHSTMPTAVQGRGSREARSYIQVLFQSFLEM